MSQSEQPAPKEIMAEKLRTDLSVYGSTVATGASIMPENVFQERKGILNYLQRCHQ